MYSCRCDCGAIKIIRGSHLRNGQSSSCGCLANELLSERSKTHGMTNTRLFNIWRGMKNRCNSPGDYHYKWYGARGIKMCDAWKDDFKTFYDWALANGYREGLTIDRMDNNGDYCPENCRWITHEEQMCNTRENVMITYNGKTQCASMWAREMGIRPDTLTQRKRRGWSDEQAISTPLGKHRGKSAEVSDTARRRRDAV